MPYKKLLMIIKNKIETKTNFNFIFIRIFILEYMFYKTKYLYTLPYKFNGLRPSK